MAKQRKWMHQILQRLVIHHIQQMGLRVQVRTLVMLQLLIKIIIIARIIQVSQELAQTTQLTHNLIPPKEIQALAMIVILH